jgi:hypothetical protein
MKFSMSAFAFTFEGGREVRCPAQAVGTVDTQAGLWAWA